MPQLNVRVYKLPTLCEECTHANADDGELSKHNRNRKKGCGRKASVDDVQNGPDYPPQSEMQKSRFKFFLVAPPALKNP